MKTEASILLVDDDRAALRSIGSALERRIEGIQLVTATSVAEAIEQFEQACALVAIVDLSIDPDAGPESGLGLIESLLERDPALRIIVLTGHHSEKYGVRSLELGAASFLAKPPSFDHLAALVRDGLSCASYRRRVIANEGQGGELRRIGALASRSPAMAEVIDQLLYCASNRQPVLLLGETGVGKGFIASVLHQASFPPSAPFVRYQPGIGTSDLVASELFGHQRGAFTGAIENRRGLIEEADKGSLFIDEVDELPPQVQVLLLQTLQEKTFRRLGTNAERRSDFRLIAATNRPLDEALESAKLRLDFYHRIAHVTIEIPPLRARREDIVDLSRQTVTELSTRERLQVTGFAKDAERKLLSYAWPGNVRELQAVVTGAVYRAHFEKRRSILAADLALAGKRSGTAVTGLSFRKRVEQFESSLVREALEQCDQNQSRAAALLQLDRTSLRRIVARTSPSAKRR